MPGTDPAKSVRIPPHRSCQTLGPELSRRPWSRMSTSRSPHQGRAPSVNTFETDSGKDNPKDILLKRW